MLLCPLCCILHTCLGCDVRLVDTYYICTYIGSTCLRLLQKPLSLQHDMLSELCTDFTATLHLSPGLYSSYSRLSSFMSILCMICTSCDFFTSCTTSLHFTLICHFPLHTSHVTDHSLYFQRKSHSSFCSFRFTWHCLAFVFQVLFVPLDHIRTMQVLTLLFLFLVWGPN